MPSFKVELPDESGDPFDMDFEVFCGTCGKGICHLADTRTSYRRRLPQVTVDACPKCLASAKDEGFESRNDEVAALEQKIADLEAQAG